MSKKVVGNAKHFVSLGAISIIEKVIAFVFQAMIAGFFGASLSTDSYFSAMQLFDLIDCTLLGAFVISLINIYNKISHEDSQVEAGVYISKVNSFLSVFMLIISAGIFFAAPYVSLLIAPGISSNNNTSIIRCIRILALMPLITALSTTCQAVLRAKKNLLVVNTRSLFISVCGIITILSLHKTSLLSAESLSLSYLLSTFLFTMLLYFSANKYGKIGYKKIESFEYYKPLLILAVPTIISNGVTRLSMMADQIISSTLGDGSITCLSYANSLFNVVHAIFVINLCMILMSDFSILRVDGKYEEIRESMNSAIRIITILLIPITFITMLFNNEIVTIIFERGQFNHAITDRVGGLLMFYSIGFIPSLLNNIFNQVLYAFDKMKTAMINNVIALLSNILLNILLSKLIGINGIAISTTLSSIIGAVLCFVSVNKVLPSSRHRNINSDWIKVIASGFVVLVVLIILKQWFLFNVYFSILYALLSLVIYLLLLFAFKNRDVQNVFDKYVIRHR